MKDIFEFVAIITKFDELHNEKRIDTDFFYLYHLVTKEWVPNNFVILNTVKDLEFRDSSSRSSSELQM